ILTEPENALTKQYRELMKTEGVTLEFDDSAIREIAKTASFVNSRAENIGARRLHTILSTLLEDLLFDAPQVENKSISITGEFVKEKLHNIVEDEDLRKYIL
ncbi:MAG: HslU--HslV peptidase ATPase subunit, partial [Calditrichaeota bacterium]|nr:HslU--HslV peptidase ATPase subunit [Calditrichota bacterium]